MFALADSLSHVISAAFTQARLKPSLVSLGLLRSAYPIYATRRNKDLPHQKLSTFNEGPEMALVLWSGIPNILLIDAEIAI